MNTSTSQTWRNNFVSELLPKNDRAANTVKSLALADPDYPPFVEQYRELSFAPASPALESELARDLLELLQQMPNRAAQLAHLSRSGHRWAFDSLLASRSSVLAPQF